VIHESRPESRALFSVTNIARFNAKILPASQVGKAQLEVQRQPAVLRMPARLTD
jgi:hypothetical protein